MSEIDLISELAKEFERENAALRQQIIGLEAICKVLIIHSRDVNGVEKDISNIFEHLSRSVVSINLTAGENEFRIMARRLGIKIHQ